jgi:2-C-methyl-D-erythritol 4-phosphate cytidylyltransferase
MTNAAAGRVAAVIPAAGSGSRLGSSQPKAFVELNGLSLLTRSAHAMSAVADVIAIAVPADSIEEARKAVAEVDAQIHIVIGGENRQDSVAAALHVLPEDIDFILIHDAARPLIPIEVSQAVIRELQNGAQAVVPVLPVADTIKRVGANEVVVETVDRSTLRRIQTPQGFTRKALHSAYADPSHIATDDAGLMETLGIQVHTVTGSELAMKITTPLDLQIAQLIEGDQ